MDSLFEPNQCSRSPQFVLPELTTGQFDPVALETKCVHEVYDKIAEDFSSTRHSPWPGVLEFLRTQLPGALGADVGCGNGKYLVAAREHADKDLLQQEQPPTSSLNSDVPSFVPSRSHGIPPLAPILALERSSRLAEIVRERGFDVTVSDILRLPYCIERLDFFVCIAVLHHLSTKERRLQAIVELARLLRPGGRGLIQVWAKEQHGPTSSEPARYLRKVQKSKGIHHLARDEILRDQNNMLRIAEPVENVRLPVHVSGTEFLATDMIIPWKSKQPSSAGASRSARGNSCPTPIPGRFYHLFVRGELEGLIAQVPSLRLERAFYEQGNWAAIVVKLHSVNTSSEF